MSVDHIDDALASFFDDGWISEVLYEVKSGKEATVHCCRAGEQLAGSEHLVAAKVYRPIESRRFKNDAVYQAGCMHLARNGRAKRAAENKSAFGREVQYATWLDHEWQTLRTLHSAGIDVPKPLAHNDRAILMTYLGDERTSAPNLNEAEMDRAAVEAVVDGLLSNIVRMLDLDCVHGDLSPFNILYWRDRATIIDFPQAIDPRLNPAAQMLLSRDIENICRWAAKRGVQRDATRITRQLWSRFVIGELG
jgi:RIO kinase 1